jgi:biotin carboxylase
VIAPVALLGAMPKDVPPLLSRLGIPFLLVADPTEPPAPPLPCQRGPLVVPFKSDPLSILGAPVPDDVRAVLSFTELGLLPAALLAEGRGLPGVPVATVLRTRDKLLMRRALGAAGVAQPRHGRLSASGGHDLPYPLVVKPVDGSGSIGVELVEDRAALERRAAAGDALLWEEYLDGPEYSVEAVSFDGAHHVVGVTAKVTTGPPGFVEVEHVAPAPLDPDVEALIRPEVGRCLDAVGLRAGASHTELRLAGGRPIVLETHTRAGGDRIPLLHLLAGGEDQYALALRSLLGVEPQPSVACAPCAAVRYFRWRPGTLSDVAGVEEARRAPGVVELQLEVAPGDEVRPWTSGLDRPGHVVVCGAGPDEVAGRLDEVERLLRPRYADGD